MAYLIDQINTINNHKFILLLDQYAPIDKNPLNFQVMPIEDNMALYISQDVLTATKGRDSSTPCYGFWQLLYNSKQITFKEDSNLFVVYQDEEQESGFFLYYDHVKSIYQSGAIVGGMFVGLFGTELPKKNIIEIDDKALTSNLSQEMLRPLDKFKKEQALIKKSVIFGVSTLALSAGIIYLLTQIFIPVITQFITESSKPEKRELRILSSKLRRANAELSRLKKSNIAIDFRDYNNPILQPLLRLKYLGVPLNIAFNMQDRKIRLTYPNYQGWMTQVPTSLFKFTQVEGQETIHLDWQAK